MNLVTFWVWLSSSGYGIRVSVVELVRYVMLVWRSGVLLSSSSFLGLQEQAVYDIELRLFQFRATFWHSGRQRFIGV